MNYLLKNGWLAALLLLFSCGEEPCLSEKAATTKGWDTIKTSARAFPAHGLWLHRTNHPAKFTKYADAFTGFELDVNIDTLQMLLDVYHPPEKSANIHVEDFLQLPSAAKKFFWFDCKNLNQNNLPFALLILAKLDSAYHIKNRIVFESHNAVLLKQIAAAGYYCFYNLPIKPGTDLCADTSFLATTASLIDTSFAAISADEEYIEVLKKLFPACKKATWGISAATNIFTGREQQLLKDSSVLIVLQRK